ncbi:MAG: 2Fe-2S iron-sulfur cluster-binding protein [Dehalococcoidales bacterium]|nr:2Fe-2S iron-sulfur cluster-binding protein [Dehalococcoidales bacterium]
MAEVKKGSISRRDFIKGTGLAVGGAAISSSVLAVACGKPATPTVVNPGAGENTTTTVTKFLCPYDNQSFDTLAALKAHLDSAHMGATVQASELTKFTLNGTPVAIKIKEHWTLNWVIREVFMMTGGTKVSCDEGICGMCTVIMDGKAVLSCIVLAVECEGKTITTPEGLQDPKTGELHPVQKGFIQEHGWQCGYCATGNIMTAKAFLDKNPNPTTDDVRQALSNNLCLCGAYEHIQLSVLEAAKLMRGG